MTTPEVMEYDVVIVGAGPAGLSSAIRLKQLSAQKGDELRVCVLEKGSEVGAHTISGCAFETRTLDELLPQWKATGAPLHVPIVDDAFYMLSKDKYLTLPTPPQMNNEGNYIISLSEFVRWLGKQAENLGVEIFPGFPAAEVLFEGKRVAGVITGAFGVDKDGNPKDNYQPGVHIKGRYTLFAEGCRGSLSEQLIHHYNLRAGKSPQTYGLGIKEVWQVAPAKHHAGKVMHTIGWPLDEKTYGGSFVYHMADNMVAVGFVVGLDYQNPYLDPYQEFQRFKTHPLIRPLLEDSKRIAYGARALNEGGFQSIPELTFPGGALIGCSAGFLNVPKIKGVHTAMKSGMLAAEACIQALGANEETLASYPTLFKYSWAAKELHKVRNIRPGFRFGLVPGLINAALETYVFRGKAPWTLKNHHDNASLKDKTLCMKIEYPAPDGKITFDRMSSVFLSSTNHEENQPCHLVLRDPGIAIRTNLEEYDAPEQRYCPAGVYEIVQENGAPRLQINAQNCVHCKTCDIKDPTQNIEWVPPEGGGGPNYSIL